jgi:hypothetical protein
MMERYPLGNQAFAPLVGASGSSSRARQGRSIPARSSLSSPREPRGSTIGGILGSRSIGSAISLSSAEGEGTNLDIEMLAEPLLIESLTR